MDVDMDDARAEAADVIALDDASMAVEADDDATPGSLLHGDQIVATDEDDHDERPASPADASNLREGFLLEISDPVSSDLCEILCFCKVWLIGFRRGHFLIRDSVDNARPLR